MKKRLFAVTFFVGAALYIAVPSATPAFHAVPASLSTPASPASARTIRVPEDYVTITRALATAKDGDTVDVAEGFYFERDIVIDKKVNVRSRRPYGAVVSGSGDLRAAVFIVRAECEISGFIIKNAQFGIIQRDSPDVRWAGHDLAIFNCITGISVNDKTLSVGTARLVNLVLDRCDAGIVTNDAREITVENIFVSRSGAAFSGFHHVRFFVDRAVLWNFLFSLTEGVYLAPASAFSEIEAGPSIWSYRLKDSPDRIRQMEKILDGLFLRNADPALEAEIRTRRRAIINMAVAESYLDGENWAQAADYFRKVTSAGPAGLPVEVRWRIDLGLGRAAEGRGDRERAIEFYERAIATIDRIGRSFPISALTLQFRSDKIDIYESLIGLLLETAGGRSEPEPGRMAEALDYAEQAKSRSLLLDMPVTGEDFRAADPGVLEEEDRLVSRVSRCQRDLQNPGLDPDQRGVLYDKLTRLEAELDDFQIRTGWIGETGGGRTDIPFASLEMIRRNLLRPGEALVEYFVGKSGSYAFLVTEKDLEAVRLPPEAGMSALIRNYSKFLTLKDAPEFNAWDGGHRLWQMLLGPFAERLKDGIKTLIIVPDGSLAGLPFETLVPDPGRKRFLLEDFSLRYAYSASFLARIRAKGPLRAKPKDYLGITFPSSSTVLDFESGRPRTFSALPFARREIRDIARVFSAGRTTVLPERDGGEAEIKAARFGDYRFIHFAVHNWIDEKTWRRTFLLLGPDAAGTEDGLLQPAEIRRLRLDAEMVVLSGCETARGQETRGEGPRGITTAFFRAGARAMLISHWNVDDAASAEFMTAFYRELLAGKNRDAALREVKLSFLKSKRRHPVFWAPFILIG